MGLTLKLTIMIGCIMNTFKFNSLIPELSVTGILKTKHFYVNVLGFEICYERKEDNLLFTR